MQPTRQKIVELLRDRGQATVEELAEALGLTSMAIRHHLNVLYGDNLVVTSRVRRKKHPGRPQQLYTLTRSANEPFPEDYYHLADYLLDEVKSALGGDVLNRLLDNIADKMAAESPPSPPGQSSEERLDNLVDFLGDKGFNARWGRQDDGYIIRVLTCPYRQVAREHREVCCLDRHIIQDMLKVDAHRVACMASGDEQCVYHISQRIELLMTR